MTTTDGRTFARLVAGRSFTDVSRPPTVATERAIVAGRWTGPAGAENVRPAWLNVRSGAANACSAAAAVPATVMVISVRPVTVSPCPRRYVSTSWTLRGEGAKRLLMRASLMPCRPLHRSASRCSSAALRGLNVTTA